MKKYLFRFAVPAFALILTTAFMLWRTTLIVPVTLFHDERDLAGAVVSKQALQSVVLAMEFFNSRSSSHRFIPVREKDRDVYESIENAAVSSSVAVVGGINAPFATLLSDASNRYGVAFVSMASGAPLARGDDLVFRVRPESGGRELGSAARTLDVQSYSVIVSGFASSHVQDFIRDFEAEAGSPPRRTMVFSGNLNQHIQDFERIAQEMDAILLVLPDWLAAVAMRELRLRLPHLPVFASNWAVSHRTPLLAGSLGEGVVTAAHVAPEWDDPRNEFVRFVEDTYSTSIPPIILSMGYDTVAMLDEAVRKAGSADSGAVARALAAMERVGTIGGAVPVDRYGDMRQPASLFVLREGKWIRTPESELRSRLFVVSPAIRREAP